MGDPKRGKKSVALTPTSSGESDQRTVPVVVSEGTAGGGLWSRTVDPAVPLGPELLGTCVMFSHARAAIASTIEAA